MTGKVQTLRQLSITGIEQLVADQIRRRRVALEMSQEQLAQALEPYGIKVTRSVVQKYEQGPGTTGAGLSMMISRALGLILYQSETGLLESLAIPPADSVDSEESTGPEPAKKDQKGQ
ncbi:helix-turn-helix transcriptional regulator [Thalassospira xiamenensis]|jgi:ribosome-binding protein aMBF1 (putative translation factor)|uniref:helix-turn-helix transcriptional regulator n=1 Tax=Thalassospira xiamenensis TaxID=220697 RepID=UPI000DED774E|nr:helix-turn-helix domain-containing protein [Thalassospira xiamenensis]RCK37243.1 hypothetical protein TH24_16840 [Thalassospira xiamenensis]